MKHALHFKPDPLSEELSTIVEGPLSIADMLLMVDAPEWFWQYGAVTLNGYMVPREMWKFVTPRQDSVIRLTVVQQGDKILPIVAGLALVALTAGIGTFGLPFLGAGFAAGTVGASAVATGIGIVGSLAISALTAPTAPKGSSNVGDAAVTQAGINPNPVTPYEVLPVVVGQVRFPPPIISSTYVTFDNVVHAIVGFEGRCLVEDVLLNGLDIALFDDLEYETREGGPGDLPLTLCPLTCIQETGNRLLRNFETILQTSKNDQLKEQVGDSSLPSWQTYKTRGDADEIWMKFVMPSGMVNISEGPASMPIRIEIRRVGDVAWTKLPVMHVWDENKGSGQVEFEVKIKFVDEIPSGRIFGRARKEWPVWWIPATTNDGQTWEYNADAYFTWTANTNIVPDMTSGSQAGFVITGSTDSANAWKVADRDVDTVWNPGNNSLPGWVKFELDVATAVISYFIRPQHTTGDPDVPAQTNAPTAWFWEHSDDGVNWTLNHTVDVGLAPPTLFFGNMYGTGAHKYWRITFTANNGAANEALNVAEINLFSGGAPGSTLNNDTTYPGNYITFASLNAGLTEDGAEFYLKTATFPKGVYEVRAKRGLSHVEDDLNSGTYQLAGSFTTPNFFEDVTVSGKRVVRIGQKNYRSDTYIEMFSTVSYDTPVDTTGLCCIAVEARHLKIETLTGLFTSYGHEFETSNWNEDAVPTQNNAALFREVLNGYGNFVPIPGDAMDDQSLIDWFGRCVTEGHQVNAVFQDRSVLDVLNAIAYTGMASVKNSNLVGVVEDYDKRALSVAHPISPMNSECLGQIFERPELPDALHVDFNDESDNYNLKRVIVYRRGFTALTARVFDTMTYEGITNEAKAIARAEFDLKQLEFRSVVYQYKMGLNGFIFEKGELARLSDNVVDEHRGYGHIQQINLSGDNVVSIVLENIMPYGAAQGDIETVEDINDIADIMDDTRAMAVSISLTNGNALVKQVTNVADSDTCIFTTPFDYVASGIELGNFVSMGVLGNETRRCYVSGVEALSLTERIVDLRDCADEELFD